ncbi:MAG: CARDB domain-containing protein, partial [Tepidisphaeraceae bacterium]
GTAYRTPFEFDVPWMNLGTGTHKMSFTATDATGQSRTLERTCAVSDYFDLQPADSAVVSGNAVRISWQGAFGTTKVRYRAAGQSDWKEAVGENGRSHRLALEELESGKAYEFQPIGGREAGPLRTVTRVKGLAFGKNRYGATINRDYDQRLGISVRNHGEKPLAVKLECGKPADDSRLLVGFVGDGSEGAPFTLAGGEEREFLLGISAQDVVKPLHKFPIRIASVSGDAFADEAEVEVSVRLPVVKLEWQETGPAPSRMGKRLKLINKGDALTDLDILSASPEVQFSPAIHHGVLPAGGSVEVTAYPRLHDGFKSLDATVTARAVDTSIPLPLKWSLPEGQQVFCVSLLPGVNTKSGLPATDAEINLARAVAADALDPAAVDWSRKTDPQDRNGDGKPDRWTVRDEENNVVWVGDDTDGDGEIDFVHADIGGDGIFQYSAYKSGDAWVRTNLLEAWLEMDFKLPWGDRKMYEPHDIDIVLNDKTVGAMQQVLPEGNYRFLLPPGTIKFGPDGMPEGNEVELQSHFVRGGHYLITSNFRIKTKLTGTTVWTIAEDREKALQSVLAGEGLNLAGVDFSICSADVRIEGPAAPRKGQELLVTAPVRNLGAGNAAEVTAALLLADVGRDEVEIPRQVIPGGSSAEITMVRLPWKAAPGTHRLKILIDPDKTTDDADRTNNEAYITVNVGGDATKPTLEILEPADGAALKSTISALKAKAADDAGIAKVQARIDGGLWQDLTAGPTFAAGMLLQHGPHEIVVRAINNGGTAIEKALKLSVDARMPDEEIVTPAEGAVIDARHTIVKVTYAAGTTLAAVRVNGGAWSRVEIKDGTGEIDLPLAFGAATIEAMAADKNGSANIVVRKVNCSRQLEAGDATSAEAAGGDGVIQIDGYSAVDLFGSRNTLLRPGPLPVTRPAAETGAAADGTRVFLLMAEGAPVAGGSGTGKMVIIRIKEENSNKPGTAVSMNQPPHVAGVPVIGDHDEMAKAVQGLKDGDMLVINCHSNPQIFADWQTHVKWADFWKHFGVEGKPPKLRAVVIAGCVMDFTKRDKDGKRLETPATTEQLQEMRKGLGTEMLFTPQAYYGLGHHVAAKFICDRLLDPSKKMGQIARETNENVSDVYRYVWGRDEPDPAGPNGGKSGTASSGTCLQTSNANTGSYCPNRPRFRTPAPIAQSVRKPDVHSADADAQRKAIDGMIGRLQQQGVSPDRLQQLTDEFSRWAKGLGGSEQLPPSLCPGTPPKPGDAASLAQWRSEVERKMLAWWLATMSNGNRDKLATELQKKLTVFRQFSSAMRRAANDLIQSIGAPGAATGCSRVTVPGR